MNEFYFTVIWKNLHTVDISSTTYLPRLVNVVCERPLSPAQAYCHSTSASCQSLSHSFYA